MGLVAATIAASGLNCGFGVKVFRKDFGESYGTSCVQDVPSLKVAWNLM